MITEEEIEKAVSWLRDNAEEAAQARADRLHLEDYSRSLKALLMKEHADKAIGVQEREAYASQTYITHLEAVRIAVKIDEKFRFLRQAAEAKLSAWQTISANIRGIRV